MPMQQKNIPGYCGPLLSKGNYVSDCVEFCCLLAFAIRPTQFIKVNLQPAMIHTRANKS